MKRLFAVATVAAFGLASSALAGLLEQVVPNANFDVEGNTNNVIPFFFFAGGAHYQQVYANSQFSSFGGPRLITEIVFRPDSDFGEPYSHTLSDIEVRLSSTAAAPDGLSPIFANNVGADDALVYDGAITFSTLDLPGPGNTRAFDVTITLQIGFLYDPTLGRNLLLEVRNRDLDDNFALERIMDAENTQGDSVSRLFAFGPDSTTATTVDSLGLITRFQHIPGPGALALLGAAGLAIRRRRR